MLIEKKNMANNTGLPEKAENQKVALQTSIFKMQNLVFFGRRLNVSERQM